MPEAPLNNYVEQIKEKEKAPSIADPALVDEEQFKKDYTARSAELKAIIDQDQTLSSEDKGKLWASVETVTDKHFGTLTEDLARLTVENKEGLRKAIEGLNLQAFELLISVRKTIEEGQADSVNSEKFTGEKIRRDNFERQLKGLDSKVEHLAFEHRELEKCKTGGGVMEALLGRMQAHWEEQIAKTTEEVMHEYANMAIFTKIVYPEGQGQFNIIADRLNFVMGQEHTGFYGEIGKQFTSKEGWSDMWEALKAYTTGVVKGVLSVIDPRTYILLGQMLGEATASLIFCDDNWAKIKGMIDEAGNAWDKADANGKCEMLGQFMGSIVGVKGVGMGLKAGRAALAAKVEGTALGMNATEAVGSAVGTVGKTVGKGVTRIAKGAESLSPLAKAAADKMSMVLSKVNQTITKFRGKLASLGDSEMKELMGSLQDAEKAVSEGKALAPQGKLMNLEYGVKGGELALKAAQRAVPELYDAIGAALKERNILSAVRTRLVEAMNAVGRLRISIGVRSAVAEADIVDVAVGGKFAKMATRLGEKVVAKIEKLPETMGETAKKAGETLERAEKARKATEGNPEKKDMAGEPAHRATVASSPVVKQKTEG